MSSRIDLKNWFKDHAKPTGSDFANMIDSFFHKAEDMLNINKVSGLTDALANKADAIVANTALSQANAAAVNAQTAIDIADGLTLSINQPNGIAGLDGTGKIAAAQLPSYVDDVIEVANYAALPVAGESGKIYVTLDTNLQYRWGGSAYAQLVASPGSTDAVSEGAVNLYFTEGRVRSAIATGISFASAIAVTAADTILAALGKLQAQITAIGPKTLPAGGATGQVLAKVNATDYNAQWVDATGGGSGGGAIIDDNLVAADKTWSSSKIQSVSVDTQVTPVLQDLTGVVSAFGVVKLNATATKAFRLRRASDNVEKDFYFGGDGRLIIEDILSFLSSSTGFIAKWYDQSGNGNDANQANAAYQPYIFFEGKDVGVRFVDDGSAVGCGLAYTLGAAVDVRNTTVFAAYSAKVSAGDFAYNNHSTKFFLTSENAKFNFGINGGSAINNELVLTSNGVDKATGLFAGTAKNYWSIRSNSTGLRIDSNFKSVTKTAVASANETKFVIGNAFGLGTNPFFGDIYSFIHFNAAKADSDLDLLTSRSTGQFGLVRPVDSSVNVVFEGDSITAGAGATDNKGFINQLNALKRQSVLNFGVSGSRFSDLTARASSIDAAIDATKTNMLFVWCGTNDIANDGATAATTYNNLVTYVQARRAAGWNKIYVLTMLYRTTGSGWQAKQTAYNNAIKANTVDFDAVIDVASYANFQLLHDVYATGGVDVYDLNRTYYADQVHPTSAGHSVIAAYIDPVIEKELTAVSQTESVGKRLSNLETAIKSLSKSVILSGTRKQKASLALSSPAYLTELYADNISGGTLIIAGIDKGDLSILKSKTLIEPSGTGYFCVGLPNDNTDPKHRWTFAARGGFGTTGNFMQILDISDSLDQNTGILICNAKNQTTNNAKGYMYYDVASTYFEIGTWTGSMRLRTPSGSIYVENLIRSSGGIRITDAALTLAGESTLELGTGNAITGAAAAASTHKIQIRVGGVNYYFLASNV